MRNKLIGLLASAALVGAPAFAATQDTGSTDQTTQSSQSSSSSTSTQDQGQQGQTQQGTSGEAAGSAVGGAGQAGTEAGQNEITGRVVKTEKHTVYLEHMGLVIPLHLTSQTQFTDPSLKSAKDLKEGQDVRASFSIKNRTQNVAQSISPAGQGGAGMQEQPGTQGGTMGQPYGTQNQQPSGTENQGTQGTEGTGGAGSQGTMNPNPTDQGTQGTQGSTGSNNSGSSGSSSGGAGSGGM